MLKYLRNDSKAIERKSESECDVNRNSELSTITSTESDSVRSCQNKQEAGAKQEKCSRESERKAAGGK